MTSKTTRYLIRLGSNGFDQTAGVLAYDGDTYVYKPASRKLHSIVSHEMPSFLQSYLPTEDTEKHQEIRQYYRKEYGTDDPLEILAHRDRSNFVGPVLEAEGDAQDVAGRVLAQAPELLIMRGLLSASPELAREFKSYRPVADDPPDILCEDQQGHMVGVELAEWLDSAQTTRLKILQQLVRQIEEQANQDQILTEFLKTYRVDLHARPFDHPLPDKKSQRLAIRQLLDALRQAVARSRFEGLAFEQQPLASLFEYMGIHRLQAEPGIHLAEGAWYHPEDTQKALLQVIQDKTGKYTDLKQAKNLDELILVVYYHQALALNTPIEGGGYTLEKLVAQVQRSLAGAHGPFDRVYLYIAMEKPDGKVFRLWPAPSPVPEGPRIQAEHSSLAE